MSEGAGDRLVQLQVGAPASGGGFVARMPDGRVAFVRHALPGEVVMARVLQEGSKLVRADAVEVLSASPVRVAAPCPYAGPGLCGGCDWQHVDVPTQRLLKAQLVAEQLRRVAGIEFPLEVEEVPSPAGVPEGLGWRTRVRFAVDGGSGRTAMRRWRSHSLIALERCLLASPPVDAVEVGRLSWRGAGEVEVFSAAGQALVSVESARRRSVAALPRVRPGTGIVLDGRVVGRPGWIDLPLGQRVFRVRAGSFWQVHVRAAEVLTQAVLEGADVKGGEEVADLYSGVGLFAATLAEAVGPSGSVVAVEQSETAHHDSLHNLTDLPWARPLRAAVDPGVVSGQIGDPEIVVLDPPRSGGGIEVMKALARLAPRLRRIVYVACDPASFGRDLRVLLDRGWMLASLRSFDLFPMTEHVELVAVIEPS